MTSTSGGDRDQLVNDLEQARTELHASYQGLSDVQMTGAGAVGDWSVKDVLTHITSWEEVTLTDLARLARKDAPVLAAFDLNKVDDWNAMVMSLRRNLPLAQVLRELETTRAELTAAVARLPDSALADGQFGRALVTVCTVHDREHSEDITKWRQREGL
jgi:hypothetical protein